MPDGFKAQVVATSRLAAIRYRDALEAARDRLVAELESLSASVLQLPEDQVASLDVATQYLLGVYSQLDRIKTLEFAAIISHYHNDPPSYREWSDPSKRDDYEPVSSCRSNTTIRTSAVRWRFSACRTCC